MSVYVKGENVIFFSMTKLEIPMKGTRDFIVKVAYFKQGGRFPMTSYERKQT